MAKQENVHVRLETELYAWLEAAGKAEDRPLAYLTRLAIEQYLLAQYPALKPTQLIADATASRAKKAKKA